jgi:hypothetical protein
VLLHLLLAAFAPHGPVMLGFDDTIERQRGKRISVDGVYRNQTSGYAASSGRSCHPTTSSRTVSVTALTKPGETSIP